jgi:hypothetical protein
MIFNVDLPSPLGYEDWKQWATAIVGLIKDAPEELIVPPFYTYTSGSVALPTDATLGTVQTVAAGRTNATALVLFSCVAQTTRGGAEIELNLEIKANTQDIFALQAVQTVPAGSGSWFATVSVVTFDRRQPGEVTHTAKMSCTSGATVSVLRRTLGILELRR